MSLRTLPAGSARRARTAAPLLALAATATLAVAATATLAAPTAASAAIGWTPTVDLAAAVDGAANLPDVAVDADGTAYAAYVRASSSGGPSLVQVAQRPRGGAWSAPVTVSRAVGFEAGSRVTVQPQIAVRDGAVAVAWLQTTADSTLGRMHQAWGAIRTAGGRWNAPQALSAVPTPPAPAGAPATRADPASDVSVAVRPDGGATVAFFADGKTALVTRDGAPDGTWAPATTVNLGSGSLFAGYTELAVDDAGAATLVWEDAPGDGPAVAVAERPAGRSTWSAAQALSDVDRYSLFPKLVVADDGDADVVWATRIVEQSAFAQYEVQLAHREGPHGSWTDPEILSAPGGEARNRGTSKSPALSVAPDGDLTVAWVRAEGASADGLPDRVQVRTRTAAGSWGYVADVWSGLRNPTLRLPSVAAGPGGQATVAVSGYTTSTGAAAGPRNVRVVRRERLGGSWSTERQLSVARAGSSSAVSWEIPLVADPLGDVTAAWHQVDGTGETGVQTASFRAVEEPSTPAPAPTTPTPAPPAAPAGAAEAPATSVPTPSAAPASVAVARGWSATQSRGYVARRGLLVAFRGTPATKADLVVRRGGTVVARVRGLRFAKDGRLVRRVRLSAATRRTLLRGRGTATLRVSVTAGRRTRTGTIRVL